MNDWLPRRPDALSVAFTRGVMTYDAFSPAVESLSDAIERQRRSASALGVVPTSSERQEALRALSTCRLKLAEPTPSFNEQGTLLIDPATGHPFETFDQAADASGQSWYRILGFVVSEEQVYGFAALRHGPVLKRRPRGISRREWFSTPRRWRLRSLFQ